MEYSPFTSRKRTRDEQPEEISEDMLEDMMFDEEQDEKSNKRIKRDLSYNPHEEEDEYQRKEFDEVNPYDRVRHYRERKYPVRILEGARLKSYERMNHLHLTEREKLSRDLMRNDVKDLCSRIKLV